MNNHIEDFRKSKLFQKLLADVRNIEEDVGTFNAQYRNFVQRDTGAVGVILRCHLIVEHFLDEYLAAANPGIQDWGAARLTFPQKLALADHPRALTRTLMSGMQALNALRNRVAHRLDAEYPQSTVAPIRQFMTAWNKAMGEPVPDGLKLIQEFALLASAWLHGSTRMIKRHAPEKGLPGLLKWYSDESEHDA